MVSLFTITQYVLNLAIDPRDREKYKPLLCKTVRNLSMECTKEISFLYAKPRLQTLKQH